MTHTKVKMEFFYENIILLIDSKIHFLSNEKLVFPKQQDTPRLKNVFLKESQKPPVPEASSGQTAFPFTTNTLNNFKIKKTKRWFLVFEQCLCSVPDRSKHCTQLSNPSNTDAKYKSKSHVKGRMYQFIEGANYRSLVIDIKLCSNKTTIAHCGQIAKEEVILRMLLPWRRSAPATSVNVLCLSPIR